MLFIPNFNDLFSQIYKKSHVLTFISQNLFLILSSNKRAQFAVDTNV